MDHILNSFQDFKDLSTLFRLKTFNECLEKVCECKELTENELVYKPSFENYLDYIDKKISRCLSSITTNRDIKVLEPSSHHLLTPELTLR